MDNKYIRQQMSRPEKVVSSCFLKSRQRLMPLNNKQNSNNIFRKLAYMDGHESSQERRPPRSLKHIQTQANSDSSSIINVNVLLEKIKTQSYTSVKKLQETETTPLNKQEPTEQLPFRQTIQLQLQNDTLKYLVQARKKNKKKRMLHKKQGRRFSNPDDFSSLKNM